MMLWVAKREEEGWLREEDIKKFPSRDLLTINQLWLTSSKGKFGFSVQKQIWIDLGGKPGQYTYYVFEHFINKVEWAENKIVFDHRAAKGHLPVGVYVKVSDNLRLNQKWWVEIDKIFKTSEEKRDQEIKKLEEERDQFKKRLEKERDQEIKKLEEERDQKRREIEKKINDRILKREKLERQIEKLERQINRQQKLQLQVNSRKRIEELKVRLCHLTNFISYLTKQLQRINDEWEASISRQIEIWEGRPQVDSPYQGALGAAFGFPCMIATELKIPGYFSLLSRTDL